MATRTLTCGGTSVAIWTGAGNPPWPIVFAPDGGSATNNYLWPIEDGGGSVESLLMKRGAPVTVPGLTVTTPFYIYRRFYLMGGTPSWGSVGNTGTRDSVVASLSTAQAGYDPKPLAWSGVGRVVFQVTDKVALRAPNAAVSATLMNSGATYLSGADIADVDDSVILSATPVTAGAIIDGAATPAFSFWRWVCTETAQEYLDAGFTVSTPGAGNTKTFTAYWKPVSFLIDVEAGDVGIEIEYSADNGRYYAKDPTGQPDMPLFYARVDLDQTDRRKFSRWEKTVYTLDPLTGVETASAPEEVAGVEDDGWNVINTDREIGDGVSKVVYRAYSVYIHDRVISTITNTYLLKGAAYERLPAGVSMIGIDGYTGAYSLVFAQPADVDYTVKARRVGDLPAGEVAGADSGTFVDGGTGKLWYAAYVLFAVDANGDPIGPEDGNDVPTDPGNDSDWDMNVPGGGGDDGGSGTPVGTTLLLQIVSADTGVTAATAAIGAGGSGFMSVTLASPVAAKSTTQGTVYMLTVTGLTPAISVVKSVVSNGTTIAKSGDKWPIVVGAGSTSVVVTVGLPPMKTLIVNSLSVPSATPANSVTISPAPSYGTNKWIVGTPITLTPVVAASGYSHVLWQRDDTSGLHDEEPGGSPYSFPLNADTVVTAGFRKPSLNVVLTVKGSTALAEKFDWTLEAADADDTVPPEMTHSMYPASQMGIFKIGATKLQTAGDTAYNDYVDMPVSGVDISYDGGVTWEDAGADYPDVYNAQTSPRAAARVGKHTVSRAPTNDTLHVRIRLIATVSVSVGMPPVRWGGPNWQAAGSMIGTGQNNWGCGFGSASVAGVEVGTGVLKTVTMGYYSNTLANPTATVQLATLTAPESTPFPDYFDEYPWINVELGDVVTAAAEPASGFYFAAWIEGYFSHAWDRYPTPATDAERLSEERLVWPAPNYISVTSPAVEVVVDEGMKKLMLKVKATVDIRYVLFTQDVVPILALEPGASAPEQIVPKAIWTNNQDQTIAGTSRMDFARFTPAYPTPSAYASQLMSNMCQAWGVLQADLVAFGIYTATGTNYYGASDIPGGTVCAIYRVNANNLVTTMERMFFSLYLPWPSGAVQWYDTANNRFPDGYLGVYRRVHRTNAAGVHEVGDWEFISRGTPFLAAGAFAGVNLTGQAQKFVLDLEFRVRWVPYVEDPGGTDEDYQITVGYQDTNDNAQGNVTVDIDAVSQGEINSLIATYTIHPGQTVVLHAVPEPGFVFVSWVGVDGEVVSTDADHTIDPDVDGYTFLATFTAAIIPPPTATEIHVGFVEGNAGRGRIDVRIIRDDDTVEDSTVTAAAGAEYQLFSGDNVKVVAIAASGWLFGGWVDAAGTLRGTTPAYFPLYDPLSPGGNALYRNVYFTEAGDPPETGNVPFRVGFLNPADMTHAGIVVAVNGAVVASVSGVPYKDLMLTEGDLVSLSVTVAPGYVLYGYYTREYAGVSLPVAVQNVSVTNQGVMVLLALADEPVGPLPEVVPGTPRTGEGLWLFDASTVNKIFVWRSRRFEIPTPTEFNCAKLARNGAFYATEAKLRLNAYSSPETSTTNVDLTLSITADAPRRLPKIRKERYYEIEVIAKDDVDSVRVATSMGDL